MTLTPDDIRAMLLGLRKAEAMTSAMQSEVRPPTAVELYRAIGGLTVIREKLLAVCVCAVEVEQLAEAAD